MVRDGIIVSMRRININLGQPQTNPNISFFKQRTQQELQGHKQIAHLTNETTTMIKIAFEIPISGILWLPLQLEV